jgi:hypothetical protein
VSQASFISPSPHLSDTSQVGEDIEEDKTLRSKSLPLHASTLILHRLAAPSSSHCFLTATAGQELRVVVVRVVVVRVVVVCGCGVWLGGQ